MASGPTTSWEIDGQTVKTLLCWAPKLLQMVTAAMKLKDAYSLEGKLSLIRHLNDLLLLLILVLAIIFL